MTGTIKDLELPFGVTLPTVSSLGIEFNPHEGVYETIDEWLDIREGVATPNQSCWVSEEEHQKAVSQNTLWTAQWYPHTPVGSYTVAGSSLEAVLKALQEIEL